MVRPFTTCAALAIACAALAAVPAARAQQPAPDAYQGQSAPPADDPIVVQPDPSQPTATKPKPPAGQLQIPAGSATNQPGFQPGPASQPSVQYRTTARRSSVDPARSYPDSDGGDNGIVQVAPDPASGPPQPTLASRATSGADPDGDIVHPQPLPQGVLGEGALIRARLLTRLSTSSSERGEAFRARVASDVVQDGQVLIPTGAEIDGHVLQVSSGHFAGHGSMRLRPETVVLPDGSQYRLDAQVTRTPGTNAKVDKEGTINAGSRRKKDAIEYGGGVGAGAVTGAVLGGPVGALAGGLVGAGAITVHLLVDHPQATLEPGTVLLFSLNQRLNLVSATATTADTTGTTPDTTN